MSLRQKNSNENKETSQTAPEEEPSRNGAKKSASRRKARQGWVIFKDIREVWCLVEQKDALGDHY